MQNGDWMISWFIHDVGAWLKQYFADDENASIEISVTKRYWEEILTNRRNHERRVRSLWVAQAGNLWSLIVSLGHDKSNREILTTIYDALRDMDVYLKNGSSKAERNVIKAVNSYKKLRKKFNITNSAQQKELAKITELVQKQILPKTK
ncbi:MAG: hypothetical protein J6W40_02750 [Alphaproteobacteria bacterium]|nr:hypothetical protein [Alphaproteobacteria bacterium]